MPHINRIRVNNVRYNFGTQFYDDFMMRFSCKNTIYDLANGGGKSVLMLLLFQNLIPNCTLDDKQPIEKLFRTNDGSTVIHSLIEWRLSDVHIKDNFKYMLTGFCARKAKEHAEVNESGESVKNNQSIEYFNYCIFYRSFNDNDIKNLPLGKNGERITYTGLKNYLKELGKKDLNLEVRIFDRKGDYQRFIAGYGLYESEWEIIRGINKTEGHVRTYFETNYKTTRKVVEDLLIEEIIEKSFRNNYLEEGSQDKLANTLLNIKDKLLELSKKKDEIHNYDRQISIIEGFIERTNSIRQMYVGMEETFFRIRKIHNTILENEQNFLNRKNEAEENREDIIEQKKSLGKKVETARVLLDKRELERLEGILSQKEGEYEKLKDSFDSLMEKLNLMEGGNCYLEYIEAKKEYDKLVMVIDNLMEDNKELLIRLKEAVAVKRLADDEYKNEIKRELVRENDKARTEKQNIGELEAALRTNDNEIAVAEHELNSLEEELSGLNTAIGSLKNKTSLLLPSEATTLLGKKQVERARLAEQLDELKKQLDELSKKHIELRLEHEKCDTELNGLKAARDSLKSKNERLLNSADKLSKLKEVYQENSTEKLERKIEKAYKAVILRLENDRAAISKMKGRLEDLSLHRPVSESEDCKRVLEYIRRYHDRHAISGAQYLSELEENDRIDVIRNNPLLVFSVIVHDNAEQLANDWELLKQSDTESLVPIIDAGGFEDFDAVVKSERIVGNDSIICMIGNPLRFKASELEQEYKALSAKLSEQESGYERRTENESVIREDYLFVKMINDGMIDEEEINPEKSIKATEENINRLLSKLDRIRVELDKNSEEKSAVLENIKASEELEGEISEEIDILSELTKKLERYRICEKDKKHRELTLSDIRRDYSDGVKRLEAMRNMYDNRVNRIKAKNGELENLEKLWNERFAAYFDESIYQTIANENKGKTVGQMKHQIIGDEELDVALDALLMGLQGENSSVSDKEKLINNYQISMQRSLSRLDYMGLSKSMFDEMYATGELSVVSGEDMLEIRKRADEVKQKQSRERAGIDESRTARDKLQGKIHHAISLIEKNYGSFDESLVKSEETDTFINENGRLLEALNEKLALADKEIRELEQSELILSVLKKNCERLMEKSGLKTDTSIGGLGISQAKQLEGEYNEAAAQLDKFIGDRYKRAEEFERELSMLAETLVKLGADALASELRMNIRMPSSIGEVDELTDALKETNSLIELEKQRVEKGLSDIQVIKDNFENQCIQSCINIKTELERLSRLSRITIDDETISIINLKIPYVGEELFKDRMSEYIDRLAADADTYESNEDRLKYIRNNLCWKKMFSVIVTDMNGIKLNLYKRERIAGQSRYLPYEEAVGSTGQSQGIYIQFLISIINYISSINSKNADATGLRKVIFIDNPFGAAKDVYIWEPIFKLLKTNNVQLIVPARGATPAITGRFDVNYVLGQKMCDGRQQTVVVDYFSDVQTEELDYTTLSYEQTALF